MAEKHYLGIDVGGTNIVGAVVAEDGQIIKEKFMKTESQRGETVILQELLSLSQEWIEQDPLIVSVGIGLPGIIDVQHGIARDCSNLKWYNVDVLAPFRTGLMVPVYLENDVRCMAIAERSFGAARGTENSICIALGTGIGSGIFVRGELLRGAYGTAGEVGHMIIIPVGGDICGCENTGCWETLASASAIIKQARAAMVHARRAGIQTTLTEPLDGEKVAIAAREGDQVATAVLEEAGRFLGIGLVNLINLFNPECIVIGGGMALAGGTLISTAQNELSRRAMTNSLQNLRILPAELGRSAGVIGAAILGLVQQQG